MSDYQEKIRKLLALSESPNVHEAKSALLKARQLMAEHGTGTSQEEGQRVIHVESGITYSQTRDPWAAHLAGIIGEAYRCMGYTVKGRGKIRKADFIGMSDDVLVCNEIFKYAVACIRSGNKAIRRSHMHLDPEEVRRRCDSYGYGFTYGIKAAFEQQEESEAVEWRLALAMPVQVRQVINSLDFKEDFVSGAEENLSKEAFADGMGDGKRFIPEKQIGEASWTEKTL